MNPVASPSEPEVVISSMERFYRGVLSELLDKGGLGLDDKILVVCGGEADRDCLTSLGFKNVTISNLDERLRASGGEAFAPYHWEFQDLEKLSYPDEHFDFVIVHSGLHHLRSPHRGLLEMYRVARRGILGFEPHDSGFTRMGARLGFGQVYEDAAVFANEGRFGGVANTSVPNYVYRFDAKEIASVVQTFNPVAEHERRFWYSTQIPDRLKSLRNGLRYWLVRLASGALVLLGRCFPFFANHIAFHIRKPDLPGELFPWLRMDEEGVKADQEWLSRKYQPKSEDDKAP